MEKKNFAVAAFDPEHEIYIVHIVSLSSTLLNVYPSQRPQISGLIAKEAPTKVPDKYADFVNVFFPDMAAGLPEHTEINDYAIELVDGQQLSCGPIYSLEPMELGTLKAYIETNLANSFITPSTSPAGAPILFDRKSNGFLQLCVNYRGLNNLTIKNWYLLPLIGESLDRLRRARRFIQLDLTSAYYQMRIRKEDKWKSVFRTWYGHFEYQVMPFRLRNTLVSFQRFINKIFAKKFDIFVIVYLDNIFIYTVDDIDDYVAAIRWVLGQLRKYLLYANINKCRFY